MISGSMDGVEQRHFFLGSHSDEWSRKEINEPTVELLKDSLVHGTVRTTGVRKNVGCFNYLEQFCMAVEKVAPKFFKVPGQPGTPVTLNLTQCPSQTPPALGQQTDMVAEVATSTKEVHAMRHSVESHTLAVAPETYYDVVMKAPLDGDFRDFNQQGIECRVQRIHMPEKIQEKLLGPAAIYQLKLHPPNAKFAPNVQHEEPEEPQHEEPPPPPLHHDLPSDRKQPTICINGVSCPYSVFQYGGVAEDHCSTMKKKWLFDVAGFSCPSNLKIQGPKPRRAAQDIRMVTVGPPAFELHTKNMKRAEAEVNWTDVTQDERPPTNKDDAFIFPVGFSFDRNIDVRQDNGVLTIEVKTQDDDSE